MDLECAVSVMKRDTPHIMYFFSIFLLPIAFDMYRDLYWKVSSDKNKYYFDLGIFIVGRESEKRWCRRLLYLSGPKRLRFFPLNCFGMRFLTTDEWKEQVDSFFVALQRLSPQERYMLRDRCFEFDRIYRRDKIILMGENIEEIAALAWDDIPRYYEIYNEYFPKWYRETRRYFRSDFVNCRFLDYLNK